jgi:hypothetical protein
MSILDIFLNILLFIGLFVILKTIQMIWSFSYTTYKSLTIHKSWKHAFFPPLRDRLKYGLWGDICYFCAGVIVASFPVWIRTHIF